MSLKSIEMQVALPRTQDAGKLQEQIQQRGQHLSEHAAESVRKEEQKQRTTVTKNKQKDEAKLHQDEERSNEAGANSQKRRKKQQQKEQERHPYKGKVIDYSG